MRGIPGYISITVLMLLYFIASTGFGIHECSVDGSLDVLLIAGNKDCRDIHESCDCSNHGCDSKTKHDENCCKTEIHHLDYEYNISEGITNISLKGIAFNFVQPFVEIKPDIEAFNGFRYINLLYDTGKIPVKVSNSYLSVWRL